jgi:hypothetical protein
MTFDIRSNNRPLHIGCQSTVSGVEHVWDGSLDDIRIYNRALSAAEILALYHENGWTGN